MGYIFSLFLLPAGWNMDVLGGAWAAILDHKVETMSWGWQSIKIKGACDPGDSKVAAVDFTAYIYVKEKKKSPCGLVLLFLLLWLLFCLFFFFFAKPNPTATFHPNLILTD